MNEAITITLDPSSMFVGGLLALAALCVFVIGAAVIVGARQAKGKAAEK